MDADRPPATTLDLMQQVPIDAETIGETIPPGAAIRFGAARPQRDG
jgi:hypothetical protein